MMDLLESAINTPDGSDGLRAYVARILDVIDRSGVAYQLTPKGTTLEGSFDYKPGTTSRLKSKVGAVERKAGHKLRTG